MSSSPRSSSPHLRRSRPTRWRDPALTVMIVMMAGVALPLLVPSRAAAQSLWVVPTVFNGDPFVQKDIRREFSSNEGLSLNVMLDTRGTTILADSITVTMRFPAGRITKMLRHPWQEPGTGWPSTDGRPFISQGADLPASLQPYLGSPFVTISGSAENPKCPCDADNGEGMEAVVHFLLVDLRRVTYLEPGLYHLFQTDWFVMKNCSSEEFVVEITDGPGSGLRGLGTPAVTSILDETTDSLIHLGGGLTSEPSLPIVPLCDNLPHFVRGDPNFDGLVDITDAIGTIGYLFFGDQLRCALAADADLSGVIDITDPIYLLSFMFLGVPSTLPPPYPECGLGPAEALDLCLRTCP